MVKRERPRWCESQKGRDTKGNAEEVEGKKR
jgi:hypothetical protein